MADHSNNSIFLIRIDFFKHQFLSLLCVITMDDNKQNLEENASEECKLQQTPAKQTLTRSKN